MTSAKLSTLLKPFIALADNLERNITGLVLDSRKVEQGNLFFAFKGTQNDGRKYVADVVVKGLAAAVVVEADTDTEEVYLQDNIPIIPIRNLTQHLGNIAAEFYGHPARELRLIGITGTNGKTSCSHFIANALTSLGIHCGVIGTLGNGLIGAIKLESANTTPDAISLQAMFARLLKEGAKAVAMEVSSHSIHQERVNGIAFEVAVFTNLTRDHLDYHGDMATYGAVKKRLLDNPLTQNAVVNADDIFGQTIIAGLIGRKPTYTYSLQQVKNLKLELNGFTAHVSTQWGEGELRAALIGQFNLSNVLAVLTTLCVMNIEFNTALEAVAQLQPVAGRMQALGGDTLPVVVVDYAHTPDSLEKALNALREHCRGKLYCLFGCGGDRDKGKRPIMAKLAEQYADIVVVTDDNPRYEDPVSIVVDIMGGFQQPDKIKVEHDRSKAIEYIIQCAEAGDCVLIAGRGAETHQHIKDTELAFSDIEKVSLFLSGDSR